MCVSPFRLAQVPSGVVDSVVGGNHHLVSEIEDLVREKMVRSILIVSTLFCFSLRFSFSAISVRIAARRSLFLSAHLDFC